MDKIVLFTSMLLIFIVGLIWYRMKLNAYDYTGRTTGKITKVKKVYDTSSKQRCSYAVTAEYEVGGKTNVLNYFEPDGDTVPVEGGSVYIVYDEVHPKRAEAECLLKDKEQTRRQYIALPVVLFVLVLITFVIASQVFFNYRLPFSGHSDVIMEMLGSLVVIGSVVQALRNPDSKLRKKKHGLFIGIILLIIVIAVETFGVVLYII